MFKLYWFDLLWSTVYSFVVATIQCVCLTAGLSICLLFHLT